MSAKLARTEQALGRPDFLESIAKHVSCGGTLRSYCNNLNLRYHDVIWWIQSDPKRNAAYKNAVELRTEWIKEDLVGNLAETAQLDVGDIVANDGTIKPANQWPEHVRRAVQSITVDIGKDGDSKTTMRLPDRLKAMEMIGKAFGIWKEKMEVDAKVDFADTVMKAAQIAREGTDGQGEEGSD